MKAGRLILALIFLLIFLAAALMAVDSLRSLTYEDVFPDDVNAVIWIHKPLDVPLKVLNSTAARRFLQTEKGKEMEKQLDDTLAALGAGEKKPPPVLFSKKVEGVTVYFPEIKKAEESATVEKEPATPEKKPEGGMNRKKLEQALGIGGAVVKDLYIALYGNPTEAMMTGKPSFMFAMDLGRLSVFPRLALPAAAKPLPADRVPGEDEELQVAFAFVNNMIIAGDPKGIQRMIYTIKGKPMQVPVADEGSMGEEEGATQEKKVKTVNLKPLKTSSLWNKMKTRMNKKGSFNLVLLIPNLLNVLKEDPMMADSIQSSAEKFGLFRILGLVHSNQMDDEGMQLTTEVVFDPPNPIYTLLDQQEIEMTWPKLLPDSFIVGAGMTADSYPALWDSAQIFGDMVSEIETTLKKRFGFSDFKTFLGILGRQISLLQFDTEGTSHTVHCDSITGEAKEYFSKLEVTNAEEAIASAEQAIEAARTAGAETYAAEAVEKAAQTLDDAKAELAEERKVMATVLARKAREFANAGMLIMVKQAEKAIDAAMSAGAYTYAADELNSASSAMSDAKDLYDKGEYAAGTEAAMKALELGKVAFAFGKAGSALEKAQLAGADTKSAANYNAAQNGLKNAKASFAQGNVANAISQADAAFNQANMARAAATGGEIEEETPEIKEVEPIDYTIPEVQSPRATETAEIFSSVGTEPVDYVFVNDNTMCYGPAEDVNAFLKSPKGGAVKAADMIELMGTMPIKTQALVLVNLQALIKNMGMWPEEGELNDYLQSLNLMLGVYVLTQNDSVSITTVSPVKLFDGSTAGGARSAMAALFFLAKWLFYLLGIVFLFLAVRMLTGKKSEE